MQLLLVLLCKLLIAMSQIFPYNQSQQQEGYKLFWILFYQELDVKGFFQLFFFPE